MDKLFEPSAIHTLRLKNRVIMTAIHTGLSMEKETAFLSARAKGGAAAVTAVMGVCPNGAYSNMPVLQPEIKEELASMAESIHRENSNLIVQLFHAGRNCKRGWLAEADAWPVAPSPVPSPIYKEIPRELTEIQIEDVIDCFGQAAKLCKESGAHGVEISASAGYLLSLFLSPLTNRREDQYGGGFANRIRFPKEVCKRVRECVGKEYPVLIRVSAEDMLGGYDINQTITFLKDIEQYVDAINVTGGWHESPIPQISMYLPEGGFVHLAKAVKNSVDVPVIACNRINNREIAERVLEDGCSDFVGVARAFLIDSEFVNKMQEGKTHRKCIACNKGCIEPVLKMRRVGCIFNPHIGQEWNQNTESESGSVLIAGGGPAGMQASLCLKRKGYEVVLYEKKKYLGGLLCLAAKAPYKESINTNIKALEEEMKEAGVEIRLGQKLDYAHISRHSPDLVIVATGSTPAVPKIKGVELSHVLTATEVLHSEKVATVANIVIVGGGAVGIETGLFLHGKMSDARITILEMDNRIGSDLGGLRRSALQEMREAEIKVETGARLVEISDNLLYVQDEAEKEIKADLVILATGFLPDIALIEELKKLKCDYVVVGDAGGVGDIQKAIGEAEQIVDQ